MVKLLAVDCALDACQIAVLARFQSPSNRQALRPSAQNQELRPLSDEKPGSTFSESGLDRRGDGDRLTVRSEAMRKGQAERAAGMASEAMAQAGLTFDALDRIAVSVGPGSFAGVRVGLAFARGLAVALDRPCIGFSTLELFARSDGDDGLRAGVIPAPDGVFLGVWRDGEALVAPARLSLEAARAAVPDGCLVFGPGAPLLGCEASTGPVPIEALARLAAEADPARRPADPLYLRPPYATLPEA